MAKAVDVLSKGRVVSYRYTAHTEQGKLVKGTIKAASEIAAERLVIEKGYQPVTLEVAPPKLSMEEALPSLFKVKPRDVSAFSRQLATLLEAGVSLLPAMEVLQEQVTGSRGFKRILGAVVDDLRTGSSFPQAISKHPQAFSDIYCRTIAVGEQTGSLITVLRQMADYQERQSVMAKKIGGALTYPMMVMGIGVVVVIMLVVVVLPPLTDMFTSMNVALPLPTRILLGLTGFVTSHTALLLLGLVLLVLLVVSLLSQPRGRLMLDRLKLSAPIIGPPTLMGELARFSRSMSVMVGAGLKLQDIMEMLPRSSSNSVIRDALNRVREGLLLGQGLSGPMSTIDIFPPLLIQMVTVGEESNTLESSMAVVADFYEATTEEKLSAMTGMIGPISTIAIALLVGFIALSVIMPMYTITGAFGG